MFFAQLLLKDDNVFYMLSSAVFNTIFKVSSLQRLERIHSGVIFFHRSKHRLCSYILQQSHRKKCVLIFHRSQHRLCVLIFCRSQRTFRILISHLLQIMALYMRCNPYADNNKLFGVSPLFADNGGVYMMQSLCR